MLGQSCRPFACSSSASSSCCQLHFSNSSAVSDKRLLMTSRVSAGAFSAVATEVMACRSERTASSRCRLLLPLLLQESFLLALKAARRSCRNNSSSYLKVDTNHLYQA